LSDDTVVVGLTSIDIEKDACVKGLTTRTIGRIIHFHDVVTSTNELAREMAEGGAREGTVIIANSQSEGKGRNERRFHSPRGGIYLSIVLRPSLGPDEISVLPLVMGLAVSKAIQCTTFTEARLKWPNDVLIDGKKVSGIMTRSSVKGRNVEHVIVGIGINVNTSLDDLPEDIRQSSTSLRDVSGTDIDPNQFARDLLYFLDLVYSQFIDGQKEDLLDQWSSRSDTIGEEVRVLTSGGDVFGRALGLDQTGALVVRTDSGLERISSGDCIKLSA